MAVSTTCCGTLQWLRKVVLVVLMVLLLLRLSMLVTLVLLAVGPVVNIRAQGRAAR